MHRAARITALRAALDRLPYGPLPDALRLELLDLIFVPPADFPAAFLEATASGRSGVALLDRWGSVSPWIDHLRSIPIRGLPPPGSYRLTVRGRRQGCKPTLPFDIAAAVPVLVRALVELDPRRQGVSVAKLRDAAAVGEAFTPALEEARQRALLVLLPPADSYAAPRVRPAPIVCRAA